MGRSYVIHTESETWTIVLCPGVGGGRNTVTKPTPFLVEGRRGGVGWGGGGGNAPEIKFNVLP